MKVVHYIEQLVQRFNQAPLYYGHGTDNATDEAVYLVCASLDIEFGDEQSLLNRELSAPEQDLLEQRVRQRIDSRIPVAYLTGKAWFAGHMFYSDASALIPRSPIAELILNHFEPLLSAAPLKLLDLCTGSGCIGIAAALEFPDAEVVLADISADCIALAEKNVVLHRLQQRVSVVQSDLFSALPSGFDLILCNPPYVSAAEVEKLPEEYKREPELGLLSADDGLQLPLKILQQASDFLSEDGLLIMEVGFSHPALADRLPMVPLLWLDFEHGGEGVFAITSRQLQQYRAYF